MTSLILGAGYLPFLAYAHVLMSETLFMTLLVFSTYAFARGALGSSRLWLCVSGVLCGFAALTRSEALLLPVIFFLWIALSPGRRLVFRRLRSGLMLFVLAMALVLTPWTVHNYLDQKAFIPGDTVEGLNLLIGNHPGADGTFDDAPVWSNPAVKAAISQGKREAALDDVFRDQALSWISSHPAHFLSLTGRRMLLFLGRVNDWLADGIGSDTLDALSGFQRIYTWALLVFAIAGGFAGLRRGRRTLLPLLCFFYFLGGVSVFYFQTRYRLPAMPFVLVLAAYGLSLIGGRLQRLVYSGTAWRTGRSSDRRRVRQGKGATVRHHTTLERKMRTLLSWSSGKDSAYALWTLRQDPAVELVGLLTSLNSSVDRVSMHGVRRSVLEAQARAAGLPVLLLPLPDPCSDEEYRAVMARTVEKARGDGVQAIAFGDLFLADVRAYRETHLAETGIVPLFPLWERPTAELAEEMIEAGLEAIVTCVDTQQLDRSFLGRRFDRAFLRDLPPGVDPCAENGEFHTVAVAGPMFDKPLEVEVGEVVDQGRFVFIDVALRD